MVYNINDTGHVTVHNSIAATLAALPTTITAAITAQAEPVGLSAATQTTLGITYRPRIGNRWVALGTSLTRGATDDAPIAGKTDISYQAEWPRFAAMRSDQQITLVKNAGVTGNLASDMITRFATDVTPYAPNIVTLDAGTNEFLTAVPFATFKTNFITLIGMIRAIGATPVVVLILPNSTQRQTAASWSQWQRAYCGTQGIPIIDFWPLLCDPTTGTLNSTAGSSDGTHPGLSGLLAMAPVVIAALLPLVPVNHPPILNDNVDTNNALTNGLFLGTPVAGIAPSWSASASPAGATFTVGTDATNFPAGNYQEIGRQATTGDTILHQGVGLSGNPNFAVGDKIIVTLRFYSTNKLGAKNGNDNIQINFGDGNPRFIFINSSYQDHGPTRIYTEHTIPATANQIDIAYIGNAGDGVARLGQVSVLNATRLGLPTPGAF